MKIALAGNQNSGKTTLFNALTGSNQHVGNFPGLTVERKEGFIKGTDLTVVDLPGIYSLSPYSPEEMVSRDFLIKEKPDLILNIVDVTSIERNFYLTLQLLELQIPTVIALNMMDELRNNNGSIDVALLSRELGVEAVPISAFKNEGIGDLIAAVKTTLERSAKRHKPRRPPDFCSPGPMHQAIHALAHLIEDHADRAGMPMRFAATKLIEGDEPVLEALRLSDNEKDILGHIVFEMEQELGTDREAAMADMRYQFIENLVKKAVKKPEISKERIRSDRMDALLTHKYLAFPIFIAVMALIFYLTFGPLGSFLSDILSKGIEGLSFIVENILVKGEVNPILTSLVIEGVFGGVGVVLSFLPTIVLLFFFLSVLEDTGYMARIAFIMDRPLRRLGLSGRSFVPMLLGFGCSVPAIMATRTLAGKRDRTMTILLVPFMSCNAKLPIYALFAGIFFPKYRALAMIALYAFGMLSGVLVAFLFKKTLFSGNPVPFVMELPTYRFPTAKNVFLTMWKNAREFLLRAFGIILTASLVVWLLQSFDFKFYPVSDPANSILCRLSSFVAPLFSPLGFSGWQAVSALLTGLTAKETVVSTFAVLFSGDAAAAVAALFTPASAVSFLVFTLLYTPCIAAISAMRMEFRSTGKTVLAVLFQFFVAYLFSFLVYTALAALL